jgi:2-oxoglutarate dehydrogenase E1 component
MFEPIDTKLSKEKILKMANKINDLPEGLNFNRKAKKIFADRQKMVEEDRLDWALGETLAYASLLTEGFHVRISGQDCVRGTFSHRHAILRMEDSEEEYTPIEHLEGKNAKFAVYNSLLSEYAVMGFEYGYAMGMPESLTIWEAQFGDFSNGAQIIIDQFLSSAEDKWNSQNGLVLYLPHGYEGQGAEHSSARLERFLILCAQNNMQVANCTTPANLYHLLRRQMLRNFRKPLVLMTPKSLLRHPQCVSTVDDLANGHFEEVIDDTDVKDPKSIAKLILCSGKVYYELVAERSKLGANTVAIVRLEQLYPFPESKVIEILSKYNNAEVVWVQEEPENMGAWVYILKEFRRPSLRNYNIEVVAQSASASPAAGSSKLAASKYAKLLKQAFENVPVN